MREFLTHLGIELCERGYVPDTLIRRAMRRLCQQRLKSCKDSIQPEIDELVAENSGSPIAAVPDKANEQHYELPAEFFASILGKHRKYSCDYWDGATKTLNDAELASLRITCERSRLVDGMNLLDLGCGWGSLSLFVAQHFPNCRITAVSNSHSQREFILAEAARHGVDRNLEVITADMNSFQPPEQYDRIISIEMFEHMRNHRELLRRISQWLSPEGKLFVHIFCHDQFAYEFVNNGPADWMSRNFFTGGVMPSSDLLLRLDDHMHVTKQWRWSGKHYQMTANAWCNRIGANRDKLLSLLKQRYGSQEANRWLQRWRMFFMACAELFGYRGGEEWYVSHYLMEPTP